MEFLKNIPSLMALLLVGAMVNATVCEAGTWRIRPEWEWGIQHTIDNAAPGDTILVTAGRYQRFWTYTFENTEEQVKVITRITKGPLTFIGDDLETTVFGPAEYAGTIDGIDTLMLILFETGGPIRFENMQFQNTRWMASVGRSPIQMRNCRIEGFVSPAISQWESDGSLFEDCVFSNNDGAISGGLGGAPSQGRTFLRCYFEGHGSALDLLNTLDVVIEDCSFVDNVVAVQFYAGSTGTVRSCSLEPKHGTGIHIVADQKARVHLVDNYMESGTVRAMAAGGGAIITGSGNHVGWGSLKTVEVVSSTSYISLTDGVILNGGGWSVLNGARAESGFESSDFRRNYWGTTDADQIREWIADTEENPDLLPVLFEPFRTQAVPTDTKTVGQLKGRFQKRQQ